MLTTASLVPNNQWCHVAAAYDGTMFNVYVNGQLAASTDDFQGRQPVTLDTLRIGGTFAGQLDEIRAYDRALPAAEVALLANRALASNWQDSALSNGDSLASAWVAALPGGIEGFYKLHTRADDAAGNAGEQATVWRSAVDTRAPVITATARLYGSAAVSRTVYTVTATDLFFDPAFFGHPCAAAAVTPLYGGEPSHVIGASAACAVRGWVQAAPPATACDEAGHCATAPISIAPAADPSLIAILSPGSGASFPVGADIALGGAGYDPQGIRTIELRANNTPIASFPAAGAAERSWQTTWRPTGTGTYTLTATMTDQQGAVLADTIVLAVGQASCQLSVAKTGTGSGRVTANRAGSDCGSDCDEYLPYGTAIVLTAAAATGSTFAGWSGACSGAQATCAVTVDQAKSVSASFTLNRHALTVSVASGTVRAFGIDCNADGGDCQGTFDHGTPVTLTVTPSPVSSFTGWSGGGCPENDPTALTCVVLMDQPRAVSASFTINRYALTVAVTSPNGIDCNADGGDCAETLDAGATSQLTATPAAGWSFAGWTGGGCPENDPAATTCAVLMDQARSVTARFTINRHTLSVAVTGSRSVASPAGIDCNATGGDCAETLDFGAQVRLTAARAAGWGFAGWGGACSGTQATCAVTIDQSKSVTAAFVAGSATLGVSLAGPGGRVTSLPAGIDCGAQCSAAFPLSSTVTLTAVANGDSAFKGWSGGDCAQNDPSALTCVVTITGARSVTATFDSRYRTYFPITTRCGMALAAGRLNARIRCTSRVQPSPQLNPIIAAIHNALILQLVRRLLRSAGLLRSRRHEAGTAPCPAFA